MEELTLPADPYPDVSSTKCQAALLARPGITRVYQRDNRGEDIFVDINVEGSEMQTLCLTSQQGKFVVMRPVSNENMVAERFPADWPPSPAAPKVDLTRNGDQE